MIYTTESIKIIGDYNNNTKWEYLGVSVNSVIINCKLIMMDLYSNYDLDTIKYSI